MFVTIHKILMIPLNSGVKISHFYLNINSVQNIELGIFTVHSYRNCTHLRTVGDNTKKINLASFKIKFSCLLRKNGEFYMNYINMCSAQIEILHVSRSKSKLYA
jgi:hypothetical protein